MNDNMEIQREAIIEIVGTQYEGRAVNHQNLIYQQNLIVKHQTDNIHDNNAILVLTDDGKELGFLPKGYASLYAPAIDSGRYSFTVEIVKSEPDPERPILIVKITSELNNHSEEDIENDILTFIQNIVNGYAQRKTEYLQFIYSENVNVDELLSALNKVRLLQKLHSCSIDIIKNHGFEQTSDKYTPLTKEALTKHLNDLKADINDVLKKIQKAYNESLDIDDEVEYHRIQSEIRERRKKFRFYDDLLSAFLDAVESYVNISVNTPSAVPVAQVTEPPKSTREKNDTLTITKLTTQEPESALVTKAEPELETVISEETMLTEKAFFDWLTSYGGVSDTTAKQYISNIHSVEKLYQTLFGVRRNILGATSADNAKTMIEMLLQRSEYIDANERRNNSFSTSLNKFAQFAGISVEGLKSLTVKKNYQPPINSEPFVIKTVDFDNPYKCTYYKPCSFILNEVKYSVGSWRELYTKYLIILYTDNNYAKILKGLIGKSLYGHRIDFADKILAHELRKVILVSPDFFAEGNLSAAEIIKRIKCLMELCSIDDDHMVIEYSTQEKDNESVIPDDNDNTGTDSYKQLTISTTPEQTATDSKIETNDSTDLEMLKSPFVDAEKFDSNKFTEWLINVSGLAPATAQSYYSSVNTSERIAREQNLRNQRLLSAQSYAEANETFNELLRCDAFIKMNATAHNSLTAGVRKLLQYFQETKNSEPEEAIQAEQANVKKNNASAVSQFAPDASKPFVLKDAVIEILSSNAPEITKYHEHKGGISSKNLRGLLKAYYGKIIGLFDISRLLMLDKTFQSVGKGCYILNAAMIPHKETEKKYINPVFQKIEDSIEEAAKTIHADYSPVSHEEEKVDALNVQNGEELKIETILEVIKENSDNLQYEYGFGSYEVKTLLTHKGISNVTEEQIEALMSECADLQEVEEGYYSLVEKEYLDEASQQQTVIVDDRPKAEAEAIGTEIPDTFSQEQQKASVDARHIVLRLNGNIVRAYDYSDALSKVCEFSINCKPFIMARIAEQAIQLHGHDVFYRKATPIDGYNKLSNGLQLIAIDSLSDLRTVTAQVQKYCQIPDDMITIISQ